MWRRWTPVVAAVCSFTLAACADDAGPMTPAPHQPGGVRTDIAPDGGQAPSYASMSDVPEDMLFAHISNPSATVHWEGAQAVAHGTMAYYANRARMNLTLTVVHGYSTVGTWTSQWKSLDHTFAFPWRNATAPLAPTTSRDCGQTADIGVDFEAFIVAFITSQFTEIDRAPSEHRDASAPQPDCYEDDSTPGGGGGGGGGGGDEGGGGGYCIVEYWYDESTGEVIDYEIWFCY